MGVRPLRSKWLCIAEPCTTRLFERYQNRSGLVRYDFADNVCKNDTSGKLWLHEAKR